MMKDSIGIDISKDHLDVYRPGTGAFARHTNDPAGFGALKRWVGDRQPHLPVYEATGPYHGRFEQAFAGKLPLVKVNPPRARRFAQACAKRAKTDRVDARMLARMGAALDLVADTPADEGQHELKELQVARTALVKDRTRLKNRLKTQTLAITRRHTRARLARVERRLDALQGKIKSRG